MSIGSWEPTQTGTGIDVQALKAAIEQIDISNFPLQPPAAVLPLQPLAKSSMNDWRENFATRSDAELKQLCYFFVLAEAHWPDWYGGAQNPVIWICKELKIRGKFPDKALTRWIKSHSKNRFLPYGAVL